MNEVKRMEARRTVICQAAIHVLFVLIAERRVYHREAFEITRAVFRLDIFENCATEP